MTLLVVWHRHHSNEVWCAADTRLSRGNAVATDHGPKIFPVPVQCHVQQGKGNSWRSVRRFSLGFGFSGSSLAATSTHALATACTQSLASKDGRDKPVSVEAIAELYRRVGENQIRDLAGRVVTSPEANFFKGVVFGYCWVRKSFAGFQIEPLVDADGFSMQMSELALVPHIFYPLGSGTEDFLRLNHELRNHPDAGVLTTLNHMVAQGEHPEVGGSIQIGISSRAGFELRPVLNLAGPQNRQVTFLGWDVAQAPDLDGYRVGFRAEGRR